MNKGSQSSVDSLEHALRLGGRLVENIASRQWDAPTPCSEWTVRDLLAHVVGMNLVFAAMLAGKRPPPSAADVRAGTLPAPMPGPRNCCSMLLACRACLNKASRAR